MKIKNIISSLGTVATVGIGIATIAKSNRIRAENQYLQQDKIKLLKKIKKLEKDNQTLVAQAEQEEKIETMSFLINQIFDIYSNSKKKLEKAKRQKQSTLKVYQEMDKNLSLALTQCLEFSEKILKKESGAVQSGKLPTVKI